MFKLISVVALGVCCAGFVQAVKKFSLTATSIVPAAKGHVELGKDRNGNTELELKVQHLAHPASLSPSQSHYVVWLQVKGSASANEGELKVNGNLEGTFRTVTPSRSFDVFVTGENDGTVISPSGPEVLRTTVSR